MSNVSGAASHKKKNGMLTVLEDQEPSILQWSAIDPSVAVPLVEIRLDFITSLRATNPNSNQMMIKVLYKDSSGTDEKTALFSFTNRSVMDNIQRTLQQVVARKKASSSTPGATTTKDTDAASSAATPSSQVNSTDKEDLSTFLDSDKLLKDHKLQQKLLVDNKTLMITFKEAVMSNGLDPEEFWKTRLHLLRSYAVQQAQKRGPYNVLSTIKPVASSDNKVNVTVTREKIQSIFEQYPIVRKAYDENVPRLNEGEFWSRFFSSRLFRQLRGEPTSSYDRADVVLDKYLYMDPNADEDTTKENIEHINPLLDVQSNEQDNSVKLGNAPDVTMKVNNDNRISGIMKNMNRLSRRMLANIKDENQDKTPEVEQLEEQLDLRDLEDDVELEYNELKLQNSKLVQNKANRIDDRISSDYTESIKTSQRQFHEPFNLTDIYNPSTQRQAIFDVAKEISQIVKQNTKQYSQGWQAANLNFQDSKTSTINDVGPESLNISPDELEELRLTHMTSIEFLRHFWSHLGSGSKDKQDLLTLKKLHASVSKCISRVEAVVDKFQDSNSKQTVHAIMQPLVISLNKALAEYQKASSAMLEYQERVHKSRTQTPV
ncbi:hypothetical protein LJB42_003463 [Komagataella kurtzmanii]|nr:hypothetical protein LJB42_003463 [Komagataella kurtzmanii]